MTVSQCWRKTGRHKFIQKREKNGSIQSLNIIRGHRPGSDLRLTGGIGPAPVLVAAKNEDTIAKIIYMGKA